MIDSAREPHRGFIISLSVQSLHTRVMRFGCAALQIQHMVLRQGCGGWEAGRKDDEVADVGLYAANNAVRRFVFALFDFNQQDAVCCFANVDARTGGVECQASRAVDEARVLVDFENMRHGALS